MVMNIETRWRWFFRFLVVYIVWGVAYTAVGEVASHMPVRALALPLDTIIPFVPEFEYLYLLCYVLPFVPLVVLHDSSRLKGLMVAFVILNVIAFAIFLLFPVYCPRPEYRVDSVATFLLSLEHAVDKPVNNFPSLHAGVAWLLYLATRGISWWVDFFMICATIGICVAALFVKQHYVVDVAAGVALAWGIHTLIERAAGFRHRTPVSTS